MSDQWIIRAENVGKKYRLRHAKQRYVALRDVLMEKVQRASRRLGAAVSNRPGAPDPSTRAYSEDFWALDAVNFEVRPGEVVGIIGPNGAGKSTLLKILSRITEPTAGRLEIVGRVGSLLEVGTGFHPELTGRENIFLNGAILGMSRTEMQGKFDEIVDFAEVEKFLDTPVKHYSSGMYVRLAFAVAAHLEPEILVVDEVLAVGDAEFQKKCLGKLRDVSHDGGRAVLFVSHSMPAIEALCTRAILLQSGRVVEDGEKGSVIRKYLMGAKAQSSVSLQDRTDRQGDGSLRMTAVLLRGDEDSTLITSTSPLTIRIRYTAKSPVVRPRVLIGIYDSKEICVYGLDSDFSGGLPPTLPAEGTITCVTSPLNLTAGACWLNLSILSGTSTADYVQRAVEFNVENSDFYGTGRTPGRSWTLGLLGHTWQVQG